MARRPRRMTRGSRLRAALNGNRLSTPTHVSDGLSPFTATRELDRVRRVRGQRRAAGADDRDRGTTASPTAVSAVTAFAARATGRAVAAVVLLTGSAIGTARATGSALTAETARPTRTTTPAGAGREMAVGDRDG